MHEKKIEQILTILGGILIGKRQALKLSLACLLARGHLLLEDLPGMGKTTLSHALASVLGLEYQRIQFTSDLLPGDILGGAIFNPQTQKFHFHRGPIFTEVLLADEINRTTPKSQSALLEAMEERQVTIDRRQYPLSDHFFVIATQNPNSSGSGTFPLPDSQLDRFLMRISLGYPAYEAEMKILKGENQRLNEGEIPQILDHESLTHLQAQVQRVKASDAILDYILRIGMETRQNERFQYGLSPRGTQAILSASRAYAFIEGRDYVVPDDVKGVLHAVCAHRLRDNHAQLAADGGGLVDWLLHNVPVMIS